MIETKQEYIKESQHDQKSSFKLGTVTALISGSPKIRFDGEHTASEKLYKSLKSYTPTVNDRVLMAAVSGTYVILGAIK